MTTVRVHTFSTVSMQSFYFRTVSNNQQQQQKSPDPSDVGADLLLLGSKREERKTDWAKDRKKKQTGDKLDHGVWGTDGGWGRTQRN